tara:strand:+ start:4166 stop:4630 length:465 start_codon:yes stop_codon:yes gene_type:complete
MVTNMKVGKITKKREFKVGPISKIYNWIVGFEGKSDFDLARISIMNDFNLKQPTRENILTEINQRRSSKQHLKLGLGKVARNQNINTHLGLVPFKNFLLRCDKTTTDKEAVTHLFLNYDCLTERSPSKSILGLIGSQCCECGGRLLPNTELKEY